MCGLRCGNTLGPALYLFWLKAKVLIDIISAVSLRRLGMGKTKKRTTQCKRKTEKEESRAIRQAEVEHERITRRCSCSPRAKHRDDCPVGYPTKDGDSGDDADAAGSGGAPNAAAASSNSSDGNGHTNNGTDEPGN